jgi:glycolate oxidase FAD binding subunit
LYIDGFGPIPLLRPDSVAELAEEVRRAREQRQAIYPVGGRTHLGLGAPPSRAGIAIETINLNKVIDYPSRDLTITVQAGIRVSDLQAILAKENQRLAVDIARAEQATLGGVLAVNASGPRRYGCGTLRDYLIGVSFVNDDGHEIKSGGRVVKNVAGYDMCKLLVGSLGTVGIITQATLKLRPLAEAQAQVLVEVPLERIDELLELAHRSQTRPCCVELLNPTAIDLANTEWPRNGWALVIGFEDNEQAVAWQVRTIQEELARASFSKSVPIRGAACTEVWQNLVDFAIKPTVVFRMRASLPPQIVGELCRLVSAREEPWQIQSHAGNGIVQMQADAALGKDKVAKLLTAVIAFAADHGGNAVVETCPPEWKAELPVWGSPRDDFWLMRRIKQSLDPHSLFNPGRFVGGI